MVGCANVLGHAVIDDREASRPSSATKLAYPSLATERQRKQARKVVLGIGWRSGRREYYAAPATRSSRPGLGLVGAPGLRSLVRVGRGGCFGAGFKDRSPHLACTGASHGVGRIDLTWGRWPSVGRGGAGEVVCKPVQWERLLAGDKPNGDGAKNTFGNTVTATILQVRARRGGRRGVGYSRCWAA